MTNATALAEPAQCTEQATCLDIAHKLMRLQVNFNALGIYSWGGWRRHEDYIRMRNIHDSVRAGMRWSSG
ncbi:hypothetical protein LCGC14_0850620 [marine sediment metagenome]|uniref:Uncharacterized protein n=1 Tax=marine sediment metagenome TaxID=412755 RepID=A0A0F9PFC7_9ZZZZ